MTETTLSRRRALAMTAGLATAAGWAHRSLPQKP